MTKGAQQFVRPLAAASLSAERVYSDIFSLTEESEMGHLRLAAEADLVVVAPATADLLAKMAAGLADDLASTALLATDKPVLVAPAMNFRMWGHAATRANVAVLDERGIHRIGPNAGALAEGESGVGRMAEPSEIVAAVERLFEPGVTLKGRRAIVTSGPTHEAIDPVRYIANRSSGKQGHAIAAALARLGAATVLVSGPTGEPDPFGVTVVPVESARDMLAACEAALPADIAVCAAAVADWRVEAAPQKLKKKNAAPPTLKLVENPDILATLSKAGNLRPRLVVGFAAETEIVVENAQAKRLKKGCDWILANDVSVASGTFGGNTNTVHLIDQDGVEDWPPLSKREVALRLAQRIAAALRRNPVE
jgi:phosphopantothenoylcysteine decarboxylase / phosphopantothenate---cysteine ligase